MKKFAFRFLSIGLMAGAVALTSCHKDDHDHDHGEQEIINVVRARYTPVQGGTPQVAEIRFEGGPGSALQRMDTIKLEANKLYRLDLELRNETVTPAVDVTAEIREEAAEHQFFFFKANPVLVGDTAFVTTSASNGIIYTYGDRDRNNRPLGLTGTLFAPTVVSSGKLAVTLKHQPAGNAAEDKNNSGNPRTGNINRGETDIEVEYPLIVR
jgi:hypothetical protein